MCHCTDINCHFDIQNHITCYRNIPSLSKVGPHGDDYGDVQDIIYFAKKLKNKKSYKTSICYMAIG